MIGEIINWFFMNFGLAMLILAVIVILATYKFSTLSFAELSYRWIAFFPLGITGLYSFIMHAFFGNFTASTIGWQNSPFQFEVAVANLGMGLIGVLAFNASYGFRKAVVIANTCWLWGDAAGHIYQMLTQHNFASGNAGSWFWMDVFVPLILIICLLQMRNKA